MLGQWVLLFKSSPLSVSTYVIESLMGLKTGARLTRSTNKQTARSEKPCHSVWEPTGRFSWMAPNDDYYGRHMNAIWCNPTNPAPPSISRSRTGASIRAQPQHVPHAPDDSFRNFKVKTRGQSMLIIVTRLETCRLFFFNLVTRFKQSQVKNRKTTSLLFYICSWFWNLENLGNMEKRTWKRKMRTASDHLNLCFLRHSWRCIFVPSVRTSQEFPLKQSHYVITWHEKSFLSDSLWNTLKRRIKAYLKGTL